MSGSNTQGSYFQRRPGTVMFKVNPAFAEREHFMEGIAYAAIGRATTLTRAYEDQIPVCIRHERVTITVKSDSKPAAVVEAWEAAIRSGRRRVDIKDLPVTSQVIDDPNFDDTCLRFACLYFRLADDADVERAIMEGFGALSLTTGRFPHGMHGDSLQLRVGPYRVIVTPKSNPNDLLAGYRAQMHLKGKVNAIYIDDWNSKAVVRQMKP